MKVIAINDGPETIHKVWYNGTHHAYHKGEVFELAYTKEYHDDEMVIFYSDIDTDATGKLSVFRKNFMDLDEWRNSIIENLLEDGDN
jgi:hypothetical protein